MKKSKVRKHTRKVKNGATTVRRHTRTLKKSNLVDHFKRRYGIKSGISIKSGDYADPEGTSLARTESTVDKKTKEPISHEVVIREAKVKEAGENRETLIQHELSHILAREKNIAKLPEYKAFMKLVKGTDTYKDLVSEDDSYGKDSEEIFARVYSQMHTGDSSSNEYLFSSEEIATFKPTMEKLLEKLKSSSTDKKASSNTEMKDARAKKKSPKKIRQIKHGYRDTKVPATPSKKLLERRKRAKMRRKSSSSTEIVKDYQARQPKKKYRKGTVITRRGRVINVNTDNVEHYTRKGKKTKK